jgi:organic hydroperoxide reductase OsmC/OhrA
MKHVAMQKKGKRPEESTVTAQVGIGPRAEGQSAQDRPGNRAGRRRAGAFSGPYSDATRHNIDVRLELV